MTECLADHETYIFISRKAVADTKSVTSKLRRWGKQPSFFLVLLSLHSIGRVLAPTIQSVTSEKCLRLQQTRKMWVDSRFAFLCNSLTSAWVLCEHCCGSHSLPWGGEDGGGVLGGGWGWGGGGVGVAIFALVAARRLEYTKENPLFFIILLKSWFFSV